MISNSLVGADTPATEDTFKQLLEIVTNETIAPDVVESMGWDVLVGQWAQGWTHELVRALLVSDIDLHAFLGQLLRRIWVTMLGPSTSVVGSFEAEFPYHPPHTNRVGKILELEQLLTSAHPGLDTLDTIKNPWGMMFHPPEEESWAPTPPYVSRKTQEDALLVPILLTVRSEEREDLNDVFIKAIPLFATGLTGIGHSTEVRAFMFCYISSVYSPLPNTTIFHRSSRCAVLVSSLLPLASNVFRQLVPIMKELSRVPLDSVRPRWHTVPVLPMWYFLNRNFSPFYIRDSIKRLMPELGHKIVDLVTDLQRFKDSLPMLPPDPVPTQDIPPLPLSAIIALCVFAQSLKNDDRHPGQFFPKGGRGQLCASWLFFTSPDGVDAYKETLARFGLSDAWSRAKISLKEPLIDLISTLDPKYYKERILVVTQTLLELWSYTSLNNRTHDTLANIWLRHIALGDVYSQAFINMISTVDRTTGQAIFSKMIKMLQPFPNATNNGVLPQLQKLYETSVIDARQDLIQTPYFVDHFVLTLRDVARHCTPVAQALSEGGVMTLLTAIRKGWYNYPETDDGMTPEARQLVRDKMCEEMLSVLSERMYLASQARLVANPQAARTPIRAPTNMNAPIRRPIWMATGG